MTSWQYYDNQKTIPLTYKGRTYLPLRAIAEAVGIPVDYDNTTKTVFLGTKPGSVGGSGQEIYINATAPEYADSVDRYTTKKNNAEKLTTATGETFEFGFCGDTRRFMKPTFKCDFQ